ncbi:hypothetical protein CYMTET_34325 [Cymbomonas tetramitiformis]|uniref:Uncharacterized protein n=1 Tax=Cymbomonas tetramitiformis TaxID=36881 RepID=A0AAE0FBS5_9CHLO|nr:hypothetical protein CYMTET_34325 [Cymbomonas tetramitiformis]
MVPTTGTAVRRDEQLYLKRVVFGNVFGTLVPGFLSHLFYKPEDDRRWMPRAVTVEEHNIMVLFRSVGHSLWF